MPDIDFGNPDSSVAIVTLWSDRKKLLPDLDKQRFSIIGNLYSSNGINYMLQTLLACPHIRHLVVWGFALTKSDEDLFRLWDKGVTSDGKIPDSKISILIEPELVDLVRANVQLIDLRGKSREEFLDAVNNIDTSSDKRYAEPKSVDLLPEATVSTIPSPLSGHFIYEESVFAAWIKILNYVMKFGNVKQTEFNTNQKEYNNIMVTIGKNFSFLEYGFKDYFSEKELKSYISSQILAPKKNDDLSYTYGDRMFNYKGIDQIEYIISKLGKSPHSRRAVAVLWDPEKDQQSAHGPCLNLLSFNIHNDELFASIVFRSHDVFKAWPKNVLGLMALQRHVVEQINNRFGTSYSAGRFTITSISAHIYSEDWKPVQDAVDSHLSIIQRLNLDPKGLFVVSVQENDTLRVEYRSNAGELLQVFEGSSGEELYRDIANNDIFSFFVHSAYLGYQISKAEHCMKQNIPYVQDKAPDFK